MLRQEKKMTQAALAKELSYGATAISNYESGHNQPSISDLKKIASIFDVSMDYLLGVNDIRMPYEENKKMDDLATFRQYYDKLNARDRRELFQYMQWLLNRPQPDTFADPYSEDFLPESAPTLRVAQNPDEFKV